MSDWKVKVRTQSGYIKDVKVDDCAFREDAERQALSSTGANEVLSSIPWYKTYDDVGNWRNPQNNSSNQQNIVEVHHYHEPEPEPEDDEEYYNSLDEQEEEMYDLMCQIAMMEGKKLPTISEFYEWLESN